MIGGAASASFTLAYTAAQLSYGANVRFRVIDPQGFNGGAAYNHAHPGLLLNQPCQDMDPFFKSLLQQAPPSFLNWLNQRERGQSYDQYSFVSRVRFGDYLRHVQKYWVQDSIRQRPYAALEIMRAAAQEITLRHDGEQRPIYRIGLSDGQSVEASGVLLTTGHQIKRKTEHPLYIPAYADADFSDRLHGIASNASTVTLIGYGAATTDVMFALEQGGYTGRYRVVSPHMRTHRLYEPKEQLDRLQKSGLMGLGGRGEEQLKNHAARMVAEFVRNRSFFVDPHSSIQQALVATSDKGMPPYFFLQAARDNQDIIAHPATARLVQTFLSNPLSAVRYACIEGVFNAVRVEHVPQRVSAIDPVGQGLSLVYENQAREVTEHPVIDCAVVTTGATNDVGVFHSPLLEQMAQAGLIARPSSGLNTVLPISSLAKNVWLAGTATAEVGNDIKLFAPTYREHGAAIAAHIKARQRMPVNS